MGKTRSFSIYLLKKGHVSHLFNQGINAIELMRLETQAVDRLEALVRDRQYRIVFAIVTRKPPAKKSLNLPLFSRISLMRGMKALRLMDVKGNLMFISDNAVTGAGSKKKRKKREAGAAAMKELESYLELGCLFVRPR